MFEVYADDKLLYSPRLLDEGYAITEPQATLELNKAGSFTFNLPKVNPLYSSLKKLKTIITIRDDGEVFWKGRVLNDTKDFYNTKAVTCEGELAFLNDIQYEPHDYSKKGIKMGEYFKKLIEHYASECTEERTIKLGIVSGAFTDVLIYPKTTDYTNIWNLISGNLIGASTGKVGKDEVDLSDYDRYLYIRRQNGTSYIDFMEDIGKASGQVIEFCKNLLDLSEYVDATNVYTQIIPLGKADSKGNRVDIKLVNGGKNYLESASGIALFGKIQRSVIWDDVTNRNTLKENGQRLLDKAVEMAIKITIRAFDLHQINVDTDKIEFGDKVHVVSLPHEISSNFLCSKIVYHIASLENTEYTFGLEFESMTSNYASYKRTYQYKMESAFDIGNQNAQDLLDAVNRMDALQTQVDGNICSWFYPGVPTSRNYPANEWTTTELKKAHTGDLYYDKSTGIAYRWTNSIGPMYLWVKIEDKQVQQALTDASRAQSTADGKIRCFSAQPYPPYEVGDLWVQGDSGDILYCQHDRESGSYVASDWVRASKYTDDSYAKNVAENLAQALSKMNQMQNQLDGKVETWYANGVPTMNNAPANGWKNDTVRKQHLGDMYFDRASGKVYHWTQNGSSWYWELIRDADIQNALTAASNAQSTADGKVRCFSAQPYPPYEVGDLWVQGNSGDILCCQYDRKSGSYVASDWVRASKYTDDTAANNAYNHATDAGKTATDYIKDNGSSVQVGPRGDSNVTMTDNGLVFTGIRNMTAIWTNWSAESGMSDGTTVCNDGRLSTYNAVLIGFKEYYASWFDSGKIDGNDIQYHIVLLNGQTSICTRIWDYTRARRVTAQKGGITFGISGYYTSGAFGVSFHKNNKCCVPYVIYGVV